jgi:hypothetical protein
MTTSASLPCMVCTVPTQSSRSRPLTSVKMDSCTFMAWPTTMRNGLMTRICAVGTSWPCAAGED